MKGVNLICLDIDGVLNNLIDSECFNSDKYINLSKHNIKLLNKIIKETSTDENPTKILLSSSWRKYFTGWFGINVFFEAVGINPVCIDKTPELNEKLRGFEILSWLTNVQFIDNRIIKSLCILDDEDNMDILKPWQIQTDPRTGLTIKDVNEAIKMLNKPFDFQINLGINK